MAARVQGETILKPATVKPRGAMKIAAATLLAALVAMSVPGVAGAAGGLAGGSEYSPTLSGAGGELSAENLDFSSSDAAGSGPQADPATVVNPGLSDLGSDSIGILFPVLLGLALIASLAESFRRMRTAG